VLINHIALGKIIYLFALLNSGREIPQLMRTRIALTSLFLFVSSLALFLFGIGKPPSYVLDESIYVVEANDFVNRTVVPPTIHPPLAKMMISTGVALVGDTPAGWRVASAIFGALTLVAIFLWAYLLLDDYHVALIAAGLTVLNNFLFVISRLAMLDVFYFAFLAWGLVAFTAAIKLELNTLQRRLLFLGSGVLLGLSGACKWLAVVTLAALGLMALIFFIRNTHHIRQIGLPTAAVSLIVAPAVVYWLVFWPFLHRYGLPFTWAKVASMNFAIWHFHTTDPGNAAVGTRWYTWIFRIGPERGQSYLVGNYVVVWGGFLALLNCLWRFWQSRGFPEGFVALLYAVNLLQWIVIPQHRTMYYYYYPCAMFLCVALAMAMRQMRNRRLLGLRPNVLIFVAAALVFLYCYPRMAALDAPYDCILGCWN
jgi:dolichyl-phosphate-mannose-protein mannosyltransferase